MTIVVIDIETIPDETKISLFNRFITAPEDKLDEWTPLDEGSFEFEYNKWQAAQMSLTPEYAKIVGLNYMVEYMEPVSRWVGEYVPSMLKVGDNIEITERNLLMKFWTLARENSTIVTFNGLAFDLEVIKVRTATLGEDIRCDLTNLKPWEQRVIDIMKKMYSNRKPMKLKAIREIHWNRLLEIAPLLDNYADLLPMEGNEVYGLYKKGDIATLKRYGEFDALTNMSLYTFGKGLWW